MSDLISRKDAIEWVQNILTIDRYYHPHSKSRNVPIDEVIDALERVPSIEPEIKPIEYRDCTNAMLRMWMDNVVTDGEYGRIIEKLNAYWIGEKGD